MKRMEELSRKRKIVISADSAADLKPEWIERYGIAVIYHRLHTERGVFADDIELDCDELCAYLRDEKNNAKSEVPDAARFEVFFSDLLTTTEEVLHISISDQASPVFKEAQRAAQNMAHVHVFDSGNMAGGAGVFALYAAHLVEQGHSVGEIEAELIRLKRQVRSTYVLKGTEYLQRGGRMSPFLSRLLTAFLLHPVIIMKNDRMNFRFAWSSGYRKIYIRRMLRKPEHIDRSLLVIPHASLSEEELEWVQKEVERYVRFDRVVCLPTSSAITVNVGEGTFGLVFCMTDHNREESHLFEFLPLTEEDREQDV